MGRVLEKEYVNSFIKYNFRLYKMIQTTFSHPIDNWNDRLATMSQSIQSSLISSRPTFSSTNNGHCTIHQRRSTTIRTQLVPKTADFNDNESDIDEIDFNQEELDALEDEDRVPISLVFLLVLGYIILGAFMFSIWEKWGPIEGAYFCFTTLTTIGFGDLVPGKHCCAKRAQ